MLKPFIEILLVAILVALVIWGLYKAGMFDSFRNLPDFNETDYGKEVISEQTAVAEEERIVGFTRYPLIRLHYLGGWDGQPGGLPRPLRNRF